MGICENERYARSHCLSVGDQICEDVFYSDLPSHNSTTSVSYWKSPYRWGAIPENMKSALDEIEAKFKSLKVQLSFLGVLENQLFYKLEAGEVNTCGASGPLFKELLFKSIKKQFPNIQLKDASPVAVITDEG
jgi:hypothetical protein